MTHGHITECYHGIPGNLACGACKAEDTIHSELEKTLAERGARYGDFSEHAEIAQGLQDVIRFSVYDGDKPCWGKLSPVQRQALTVICDKIARMLSGDPNFRDNVLDISGYATLMLREIDKG